MWFFILLKLFATEENYNEKIAAERNISKIDFRPSKIFFSSNFSFLFSLSNSFKFMQKTGESQRVIFYIVNFTVKHSLVIFLTLIIHTASTVNFLECWKHLLWRAVPFLDPYR